MICIAIMYWRKAMGVSSRSLFASEIGEREFALELLVLMELAYWSIWVLRGIMGI